MGVSNPFGALSLEKDCTFCELKDFKDFLFQRKKKVSRVKFIQLLIQMNRFERDEILHAIVEIFKITPEKADFRINDAWYLLQKKEGFHVFYTDKGIIKAYKKENI